MENLLINQPDNIVAPAPAGIAIAPAIILHHLNNSSY